ncbi:hypothetical protein DFJ74DRAFT_686740 [Hyaloraphidium curvatum]|nr:hypothetical protein DFJ74DRAFT_686740 [Hyaloraphidium curvatum]
MEENGTAEEGKANGGAGSDAPPPVLPAADASSSHSGPRQRAKAKTEHVDIVAEAYAVASRSTAHGVWRIFDRRRRWANRICWAFLWLTAFSLFFAYLVLQTEYLASFPTSTLITQVFVLPTPFPAVSVCISSLNRTTVAAFLRPPRGSTVLEQIADIFNSSGVACFYGLHTAHQLLRYEIPSNGSGCSARSTVSFVDYPFAWSPTLCITTPGDLVADHPGYTLTIVGRVPGLGVLDQLTYGIRQADAQFQPMLANLLSTGIHTRERFHIGITRNIRNCDPQPGGQPKCLADFQQQCVEKACSCGYPAVAGNVSLSDLVEQLPGSCADKYLNGTCAMAQHGFPCPLWIPGTNCTLSQLCGPDAAQRACPYPSCDETAFPSASSFAPLDAGELAALGVDAGAASGAFLLSVVLESQMVSRVDEEPAYTPLSYFGSVGGMVGPTLGCGARSGWLNGVPRGGR